jgi:mRNA-degrading endonuclease RelE of RelBE toxin-antitoxin system
VYRIRILEPAANDSVMYEVLHNEQVVLIHLIGHRRDIYRKR